MNKVIGSRLFTVEFYNNTVRVKGKTEVKARTVNEAETHFKFFYPKKLIWRIYYHNNCKMESKAKGILEHSKQRELSLRRALENLIEEVKGCELDEDQRHAVMDAEEVIKKHKKEC